MLEKIKQMNDTLNSCFDLLEDYTVGESLTIICMLLERIGKACNVSPVEIAESIADSVKEVNKMMDGLFGEEKED